MEKIISNKWADGFQARVLEAYNCKKIKEMEAITGIAYQTLYGYLSGKRDAPIEVILRFGKDTGVSIHWLLTGEGEKYPSKELHEESVFAFVLRRGNRSPRLESVSDPNLLARIREALQAEVEDGQSRSRGEGG